MSYTSAVLTPVFSNRPITSSTARSHASATPRTPLNSGASSLKGVPESRRASNISTAGVSF